MPSRIWKMMRKVAKVGVLIRTGASSRFVEETRAFIVDPMPARSSRL
jgi:hypothetical protein